MGFSLHEWLNAPSRGRSDHSTTAKRALVAFLLFLLPLVATVVEHELIGAYYLPYPYWLHWILYAMELITFFVMLYGLFKEKVELIVPFIVVETVKLLIWAGFTIVYLARMIINEIKGEGGSADGRTAVVPGLVAVQQDYYVDNEGRYHYGFSNHWSNAFLSRILGYLAIMCAIHAITVCVALSVFQAIRHLLNTEERQRLPTVRTTTEAGSSQKPYETETIIMTKTTTEQQNS